MTDGNDRRQRHWSRTMMSFLVPDMSCGHCVGSITRAIHTVDPGAEVTVDLGQHLVMISHGGVDVEADAAAIRQAMVDAGYTPQPVKGAREGASA
jgi:copper chaperone